MEKIKTLIPNAVRNMILEKVIRRPLYNYYKKSYGKRVLISYILTPFKRSLQSHTNYFEAVTVAEIFDELGYIVDIVHYCHDIKSIRKYDVIYGFGEALESFYSKGFDSYTKVILYSTGMHQFFQNVETLKRLKALNKEKEKWLIESTRLTDFSWFRQIVLSDSVIALGNIEVKKTFEPFYNGTLYSLNAPFYKVNDYKMLGGKGVEAKKSYVWFGSSGLIHKGLDLCLDFFKSRPDLTLHVCGPIEKESVFVSCYFKELFHTKNIHYHGFVDIKSEKFYNILKKSWFAIFPSCSEGGGVSLLTVIGNGSMIPVMTRAASVDVPNACYIEELTISGVERAVNESQNILQDELNEKAQENAAFVVENNSLENYRKNLKKILEQAIN